MIEKNMERKGVPRKIFLLYGSCCTLVWVREEKRQEKSDLVNPVRTSLNFISFHGHMTSLTGKVAQETLKCKRLFCFPYLRVRMVLWGGSRELRPSERFIGRVVL